MLARLQIMYHSHNVCLTINSTNLCEIHSMLVHILSKFSLYHTPPPPLPKKNQTYLIWTESPGSTHLWKCATALVPVRSGLTSEKLLVNRASQMLSFTYGVLLCAPYNFWLMRMWGKGEGGRGGGEEVRRGGWRERREGNKGRMEGGGGGGESHRTAQLAQTEINCHNLQTRFDLVCASLHKIWFTLQAARIVFSLRKLYRPARIDFASRTAQAARLEFAACGNGSQYINPQDCAASENPKSILAACAIRNQFSQACKVCATWYQAPLNQTHLAFVSFWV